MQSLPVEILLEIFKCLPASDLLELTEVCVAFRNLISGSNLVRKLGLRFRKLNGDRATLGSRRYVKLHIGFVRPKVHHVLLDRMGSDLTSVAFRNCKLKIDVIRATLVLCPNISELVFDNLWLSDVPKLIKGPFPWLVNVKLSCTNSDPRVFRILRDVSLVELKMNLTSTFFNDFKDVKQFLSAQTSLKTLSFNGFYRTNLFEDSELNTVKFKLKMFTMKHASFLRTDHLKRFLAGQIASLETIQVSEIENCDLSEILSQSNCLSSLNVSKMPLNCLEPMRSVGELEITDHKSLHKEIFQNFPCLKHLRLNWMRNDWFSKAVSENFQELETLYVDGGSTEDLRLLNLKKLTLRNVNKMPTKDLLRNIEELLVEKCYFVNGEFVKTVKSDMKNLKILTIVNCGTIQYDKLHFNVQQS